MSNYTSDPLDSRSFPTGWLLGYSILFALLGLVLVYEVVKSYNTFLLIESIGCFILAGLLWLRTPIALYFNAMFSTGIIVYGAVVFFQSGAYGQLISGVLLLASHFTYSEEIRNQRR